MAELHIIGDLTWGENFGSRSCFCVFELVAGEHWSVVEGRTSGCTHVMHSGEEGNVLWSFPIDIHFTMNSVEGWPKISLQVWSIDKYGRKDLEGYGVAFVPPPSVDEQEVVVETWRPCYWNPSFFSRLYENIRLAVFGGNPVLRDKALIHTNEERFKLRTRSSGTVLLHLNVISRGMQRLGIQCS
ncbi:B9 protein domain 2 [Trypanosoma conorhini]|uniref:B9 domain-containing protein 2 n=1 Tax=Trypanosoma conorhini TaxID=83891 RepID=A0A3R7NP01_9TRYP|nr:B9 protein domain 2 [Trypanosoma conorhini]RNF21158.1 B9 protein domain 2 [Trypanosoma conorhini]